MKFQLTTYVRCCFLLTSLWVALQYPSLLAQEKNAVDQQFELSQFVTTQPGDLPIILSAPHGGNLSTPDVPARKGEGMEKGAAGFFTGRDTGTEELTQAVADAIKLTLPAMFRTARNNPDSQVATLFKPMAAISRAQWMLSN